MEQQVSSEQFDQAVNILASICAQSAPPEGSQLTLWQWVDANRNALNILVGLAREALEPRTLIDTTEPLKADHELVDVSVNGSE
jgi:hypothetical protein